MALSSPSRPVLHRYPLRDQSTANASNRQSMRIGQLDDGQGLWVSFDKRGDSDHPRYWSEAGKMLSFVAQKGKVDLAQGLELSQFGSKRRTNKQKPHQDKQKLLIRQVYHQRGVLYEGDLEIIEALQAAKDRTAAQTRKNSKAKSGKTKKREEDSEDEGEEEGDAGEEGEEDEEEWPGIISAGSEGEGEGEAGKEGEESKENEEEWDGIISTGSEGEEEGQVRKEEEESKEHEEEWASLSPTESIEL